MVRGGGERIKRESVIMVARLDNLRTTSKIKTRYLIWRFEKKPTGRYPTEIVAAKSDLVTANHRS